MPNLNFWQILRKRIYRVFIFLLILFLVSEIALRIRLAYLSKELKWLTYHQFEIRTLEEINKALPVYYREQMFKPFRVERKEGKSGSQRQIITIESSVLRSIRKQLVKLLDGNEQFGWKDYSVGLDKIINYTDNDIILYEFYVYPDIFNILKKENRVLKRIFGESIDDFLYHNFVFYLHLDEKINFLNIKKDEILSGYINSLIAREEPLFAQVNNERLENFICILTPHNFDAKSASGSIYTYYVKEAYGTMIELLKKYNVNYIDLMNEEFEDDDFKDDFHFSAKGGMEVSRKIISYLTNINKKDK